MLMIIKKACVCMDAWICLHDDAHHKTWFYVSVWREAKGTNFELMMMKKKKSKSRDGDNRNMGREQPSEKEEEEREGMMMMITNPSIDFFFIFLGLFTLWICMQKPLLLRKRAGEGEGEEVFLQWLLKWFVSPSLLNKKKPSSKKNFSAFMRFLNLWALPFFFFPSRFRLLN